MRCGEPRTIDMQSAVNLVVKAARRFSDCAAEFEGDLGCCQETMDDLYDAVDALKRAEDAAGPQHV